MAERVIYPLKFMRITQNYNGKNNHYKHSSGTLRDYPIDDGAEDTGCSPFYCPCDKMEVVRIYGVGSSGVNTIWLTSCSKVLFADGATDYLTIMVEHCGDATLKKLKVGQAFTLKKQIMLEGTDKASGNHFHMSCGRGKIKGTGWYKNSNGAYVITTAGGAVKPEQVFYIDTAFTKILNRGGIAFKTCVSESEDEDMTTKI